MEEIKHAVALAWASVEPDELPDGLPEDYRRTVFTEVLRHALAGSLVSASHGAGQQFAGLSDHAVAEPGLAQLAARLTVSENALADVFAVDDDGLTLHVASTKISPTKSKATREVALLVTAARQGGGFDNPWTDVSYIRDALTQYSRYDLSNFSKYLRETGDVFNFRGKPIQQLRLTRPGWEAATQLVKTLTGSD